MVKDYFQDIVPPSNDPDLPRKSLNVRPAPSAQAEHAPTRPPRSVPLKSREDFQQEEEELPTPPEKIRADDAPHTPEKSEMGARSIRNIAPLARPRGRSGTDTRGPLPPSRPSRRSKRTWLWALAGVSIVALGGLGLFVFRPTTVTVIPRSHPVTFDESAQLVAYPEASAATGTLSYAVVATDLEDSAIVEAKGTEHAESRASGEIAIYNNYSTSEVRLIKNTRFQTADGLIFRAPEDVVVPGKSATSPGQINITIIADQPGTQYNVGPTDFKVPGLKTNTEMYSGVYAKSTAVFAGGFVGDRPSTAPGAREAAIADIRSRLDTSAHAFVGKLSTATSTVFADLMQVSYRDLPDTTEANGSIRIHQSARVTVPVFAADRFATIIAQTVVADSDSASVTLIPGKDFSAISLAASSTTLGADSFNFSLSGAALLVWKVDTGALAQALINRDKAAFKTIVTGFSSIQEAHARIEPFWKDVFPSNPDDIRINVESLSPTS